MRPLMMAAGAAPLALESDVLEDSPNNDAGQKNIPQKREKKKATYRVVFRGCFSARTSSPSSCADSAFMISTIAAAGKIMGAFSMGP